MSIDDFEVLTEDDKRHVSYGMCVLGTMAVGATFGSFLGGLTLVGAVGGTVAGLLMCRTIEQPLKRQLFGANTRMSEGDFLNLARQTKRQFSNLSRGQVLDLLAASRIAAARDPGRYRC
ncbi:hypothetical protein LB518_08605 [Mesorhizobium sp. BR1-1-16]|uniref:hypothetical protein n=1 Tax=Mesorhizobium sp. BR1-1-16 TaxID=2876653 RepID=UPI001CCA75CA|nr:hypothetical protein [Mesorhizobium sp. BR1-1-16]MBZ9936352.1 hypothetical protein [Mesorhizobium sp. BR1-1-16]